MAIASEGAVSLSYLDSKNTVEVFNIAKVLNEVLEERNKEQEKHMRK